MNVTPNSLIKFNSFTPRVLVFILMICMLSTIWLTSSATTIPKAADNWTIANGIALNSEPTIASLFPASGSATGGMIVIISGSNFTGATMVTFGGVAATIHTATSTSITVTLPANSLGVKDVVVTTPGGSVTATGGFTYAAPPTITSLSPSSGSTAGGTVVTITGTNFTGVTAVTFDGVSATGLTINSSTSINVTTPAGTAGLRNVVITTPVASATSINGFTYLATPTITSLSPSSGSTAGGTNVGITGTNFTGFTSVTFGGVPATILATAGSTYIGVASPAGSVGVKDVVVTTPLESATAIGGFTYLDPPTITSLSPSSGSAAGGTVVTVTGTNFIGATAVTIGGANATGLTVNSSTSITVTAPAGTAGVKNVMVTTPGGLATITSAYTYIAMPSPIFDEAPAVSNVQSSKLNLSASIDKAGRLYIAVLTDGATAPTAAQVKSGQNASGGTPLYWSSTGIPSSPFSHSLTIQNLAPGTAYDIYVVAEDNASPANLMVAPVKLDVTTLSNTAPVISNLNGDSLPWPGVGNTVTLDVGGNAAVTDAELDASNWDGASLTVQRIGTPLVSDIFGFNASGYTVNGGNLQTGGSTTFATFANANGILTINFNTNATNTLVRDVVRGILYRNDTPAGDATIRFTLRDGTSSATADVNVTTDFIYITNISDTQTINIANGVSFSEAIAIAAADVTGSQTIVFNAAAAYHINNVVINESLTFDMDAASGMSITGGTITLNSGTLTLINEAGDSATIGSVIAGTGALRKADSGVLSLTGSNSYAGTTLVSGGTLSVASDGNLGSGAITLAGGTMLAIIGATTIDNAIALTGAATIGNTANVTLDGVISGAHNLSKTGSGVLTLARDNTYAATNVGAGTLLVSSDSNLGSDAITLAAGTTLAINGATTIDNGITLTGAATISNTANVTLDGVISGAHNLSKTGSGVLTLARDNTYAATNVDAGTLLVSRDSNLGFDAITLAAGTILAINGATTIDNAIVLNGFATVSNSANATISGVISGPHNLGKTGAGTLTLAASNTYSGNTIVSAGGLTLTGSSSIGDGSTVSLSSAATLTLGGGNETIGSLLGAGNVVLGYNLTTGGNNASTTFSGVISGTGSLLKQGSGTLTLAGSNTYTGNTTVSAGTLALSGGNAIGDVSAVIVSSGATLSLNASETLGSLAGAGNVSLNGYILSSGGNNASTTLSGQLNGSGGFTKTGSGTLTLSGSNSGTFTGGTSVSGGGLSVASDDNLGSGALSINNSTFGITGATTIDNSIALTNGAIITNASAVTLSGVISGSGSLSKAGNGQLSLTGTSNYGGSTTVSAGTLAVNGALNGTSAVSVSSGATLIGSGRVTNLVVSNGGTLSPGNSLAVFTVNGNLQMNSGSTLAIEINGVTAGTDYDQVIVNGTASLAGNLVVNHGYSTGQGDSYTIIANDMADAITGTFSGLAEGATLTAGGNSKVLTASYIGGTGNDFTLTAPINSSPVISGTPTTSVNQDANYSFTPTAADVDVNDVLTFSITNKPSWATFNNATGALTGTPTNANVGTTTGIVISVSDGALTANLPTFNLTVVNINDTPIIGGTPATSVNQDATYSFIPTAADVDLNDVLTFSISNKPLWASFNTTTGALTGTPTNADVGTTTGIVITVSDGTLSAGLPAFNLTVVNVNDAPIISGMPATSVNQDATYSFTPTASDIDVNDVLTFSITNKPTWASFNTTTGALTGTPTRADVGTINGIAISVSDGTLSASLAAFNLTVEPVNDAPTLTGSPATTVKPGETYIFQPTAADIDGDQLTFSIANKPTWATFNTATGVLTGTPLRNNEGIYPNIVISVSDGTASVALPAFTIEVKPAPVITEVTFTGGNFVYDGTAKSLAITGTLPAGVTVTYTGNAKIAAGTYTVTANISGGVNYQDQSLTAQLAIAKVPLTITASNASMCQGNSLPTFTASYTGFIAGETESSLSSKPTITTTANSASPAGTYTITASGAVANNYEITYVNGALTINPTPLVAITSDKGLSVAKGETLVLIASGGTTYLWSNASGIVSGQNTAALIVRPTVTTTYSVTASTATSCSSTQSITIQVTEEVVAVKPTNIMSPNGDGVNDKWVIENLDLYPNNEVIVVDRSGRTIYSKKGYDNSWDATLRGLPLAEGTYYYIINYGDGKTPAKKGFITILNKR